MRTGGEFAEVFVEDKRSSSAVLDDGRVEELTSGRDRGAGIRVVVGDTTGFAHTADLSEAGLSAAAEAAAAAARGGGGGAKVVAVSPIMSNVRPRYESRRGRRQSDQGRLAHPRQRSRSSPGQRSLRCRPATATPVAASWSPTPMVCSPRTTRSAPSSRCRVSRAATPVCRPGGVDRSHGRLRIVR